MRGVFRSDKDNDLHKLTASAMTGMPIDAITDEER
jgi:hypothetical protein